jgi:hypothetical protein
MVTDQRAVLYYDSTRTCQQAGTRTGLVTDRTVLYRAGDLSIDLMVHPGPEELQFVHGQLLRGPGRPVAGVPVRLGEDADETDEYGQFALSGALEGSPMHLGIEMPGRTVRCHIPPVAEEGC